MKIKFYYWSLALKVNAPHFLHKGGEDNKMQFRFIDFFTNFLMKKACFRNYRVFNLKVDRILK